MLAHACLARFNTAEVLIYVSGPTAALLLLGAVVYEDMGWASPGWWVEEAVA